MVHSDGVLILSNGFMVHSDGILVLSNGIPVCHNVSLVLVNPKVCSTERFINDIL